MDIWIVSSLGIIESATITFFFFLYLDFCEQTHILLGIHLGIELPGQMLVIYLPLVKTF